MRFHARRVFAHLSWSLGPNKIELKFFTSHICNFLSMAPYICLWLPMALLNLRRLPIANCDVIQLLIYSLASYVSLIYGYIIIWRVWLPMTPFGRPCPIGLKTPNSLSFVQIHQIVSNCPQLLEHNSVAPDWPLFAICCP